MSKLVTFYPISFQKITQNERFYTNTNNISFFFCIFYNIISGSTNGGAILISNINLFSLISICSFDKCLTNGNGGAIYFDGSGIELNKICGNNCSTTLHNSGGSFCFINIKSTHKSFFDLLSIIYCSESIKLTSYGNIIFNNGFKYIENINSSLNKVTAHSGFQSSDGYIYFKFNLLSNNSCNHIIFRGARLNGYLNYSNIINNKPTTSNYASIYNELSGNIILFKCILINNNFNLFLSYIGGYVTVDQCYIDHPSIYSLGVYNSQTNFFIFTNIYNLDLLLKDQCYFNNSFTKIQKIKIIQFFLILIY